MRSTALRTTFALLLLSGIACGNPGEPGNPDPPANIVPVQGVSVTPQVIQFSAISQTRQLSVVVTPSDATDQAITWESTDSAVATVDALGLVTARAAGSGVFITAYTRDGYHQASVNVSVNPQADGGRGHRQVVSSEFTEHSTRSSLARRLRVRQA